MGLLECHDLGVCELSEGELLLQVFVKPNSDAPLVLLSHLLGVIEKLNAFVELEGQEEGVSNLVSDVRSGEVVDQPIDIWSDTLLVDKLHSSLVRVVNSLLLHLADDLLGLPRYPHSLLRGLVGPDKHVLL